MTKNHLYDTLEDSYLAALEVNQAVPSTLVLDTHEFKWLVALGLIHQDGTRVQHTETQVLFKFGGQYVYVQSDSHPESWPLTH